MESLPVRLGSAESVRRLRFEPGVKLAIVQSDAHRAFVDQAVADNEEAANLIRTVTSDPAALQQEIYFIVHAGSP